MTFAFESHGKESQTRWTFRSLSRHVHSPKGKNRNGVESVPTYEGALCVASVGTRSIRVPDFFSRRWESGSHGRKGGRAGLSVPDLVAFVRQKEKTGTEWNPSLPTRARLGNASVGTRSTR